MNPTLPKFNLYEELPEPIFQDMREKEAEKQRVNKIINEYFKVMIPTNLTDVDRF